ncbi:MBL fold metallo-hydrolase [Salipiger mucosus]|uniref:Metallo-beta-lactamase family protein n=1 Tax=Salipiger mucosus DSM 16094 TaxID=1123237 RepID=S9Q4C6_9RHOB|nr:MBL fold metallo-hydrolase [Salipiger mucosus]EPX76181.1 Metallo-beta-lactamase family protein [Salipiger mucosus DSM 16094]
MQDPQPDFHPVPGRPETLAPGLRRIVAPNPSPMTLRGTNTYLLGTRGVAVIDPGPDDSSHLDAIRAALHPGARVTHIVVTHAHRDHSALAPALAAVTGAPVLAFGDARAGRSPVMEALARGGAIGGGEGVDAGFAPDERMEDGAVLEGADWQLEAIHTPGHFGNHLALAWGDTLFTGDLVMGWSTSLVSPPDGDLTAFMASLDRLRARPWRVMHPGHGAPVADPAARLDALLAHRRSREAEIRAALDEGPATASALASRIYADIPAALHPAAARNVLAHLIDLTARGLARPVGELAENAVFSGL